MKISRIVGVGLFGMCILLASYRNRILEMEHVTGVDTAYYVGIVTGILITISVTLIKNGYPYIKEWIKR